MLVLGSYVPIPIVSSIPSYLFQGVYQLYCSELVGYNVLKHLMHVPNEIPHSDYRMGVRCLHEMEDLPIFKPSRNSAGQMSVAQLSRLKKKKLYGNSGPAIDIRQMHHLGKDVVKQDAGVIVAPIPIFNDNYAFAIISLRTERIALVDPADSDTCLVYIQRFSSYTGLSLQLTEILTTHKHWDHAGGNEALLEFIKSEKNASTNLVSPNLRVIGSRIDSPKSCTMLVEDQEVFEILEGGAVVRTVATPGHTAGSVLFAVADTVDHESSPSQYMAVFTGDAIFCGGYGKGFETTSIDQIFQTREYLGVNKSSKCAVNTHPKTGKVFADDKVLLFVGHEYTSRLILEHYDCMKATLNKRGGREKEENEKLVQYVDRMLLALEEVQDLRRVSDDLPGKSAPKGATLPLTTLPTTLATEKKVNPLLTTTDEIMKFSVADGKPFNWDTLQSYMYFYAERVEE